LTPRRNGHGGDAVCGYIGVVTGSKQRDMLVDRFASLPMLTPTRQDHITAATLRNTCRQRGVQVGTIGALIAQLCIRHELTLLTTDGDFRTVARVKEGLRVWSA
jgi:predicted nucleic acid-binding protein